MATNLVSSVMQFLTPDMIGRIAAALGLDRSGAQAGISAAVPALLAAFSGTAAKPGGAQDLVDAIKQQSGMLDGFANTIGGSGQGTFIEKGSSMLTSLLGGYDRSALTGAIGKHSGLGEGASNSLLGMLTPVVLGLIGKQVGSRGLDAGSLGGLFASQKDQIAQALPAGMGQLLGSTGLLDSLSWAAGSATAAAAQAGRTATAAAGQASQYASSAARSASVASQRAADAATSSASNWVYWAIPLVALAGLLWYLLGDRTEQVAQQVPATIQRVVVDGVDVEKQIGDSFGELRSSLAGITDAASARAALPRLEAATAQIEKVGDVVGRMSTEQRNVVGGLVASARTTVDQLFDKVLAIPGVNDVLKPAADTLRTKLADLSGQPSTVGVGGASR